MNIKIVYHNRLHKLSSDVRTFAQIKSAIKSLLQDKINDELFLFVQTNPSLGDITYLTLVDTEEKFEEIKEIYQQNGWPSIKFLVQDTLDHYHDQKGYKLGHLLDLDILNQSMMLNKSQTQKKMQEQDQLLKDYLKKEDLLETNDQYQQTIHSRNQYDIPQSVPQSVPQPVAQSVPQSEAQSVAQSEAQSIPYDKQMFEDYLIKLIDQRLIQLGLIQPPIDQEQKQLQQPQMMQNITTPEVYQLEQSNLDIRVHQFEKFDWMVKLLNKGKIQWPKTIQLRCISGQFMGQDIQVPALDSQKTAEVVMTFVPKQLAESQLCVFQLFYLDQDEKFVPFGRTFQFELQVRKMQPKNQNIEIQKQQAIQIKAQELKTIFPKKDLNDLIQFIYKQKSDINMEELVDKLLETNK